MFKLLERFERTISGILLVFAMLIVVYQVVQLIWNSVQSFSTRFREVGLTYAPEYSRNIAIMFFNILLMMEIMETIKIFSHSHIIKGRIIIIVCLIAASRKVLELGEGTVNPISELALAGLILALAGGYFLVSRSAKEPAKEREEERH